MPCFAELYDELGINQTRHRLLVLGVLGLPCRPGVLVHLGDRLDRRGPAGQRVARRDGRGLGAVRGLDQDPDRRGRHRAGLRLRQVSRPASLRRVLALQIDPYTVTPLWPDTVSHGRAAGPARPRRRASGPRSDGPGGAGLRCRQHRAPTPRSRRRASRSCSPGRIFADPLRRHDIAPITDGASAIVLAAGDRARELRERPGLDHRLRAPHRDPGARAPAI